MKIAVVTGASSGLGREFVRQLALLEKKLDEIWVIARRRERLEALRPSSPVPLRVLPLDLTAEGAVDRLEAALAAARPEVRVLVCAAGFGRMGSYQQVPRQQSAAMIRLNCQAAVEVTQACLPWMKAGGRILEICSTAAFQPFPYLNVYAATKAFLYRYSRALARELRPRRITVTAVCPYWVKDTEFIPTARQGSGEQAVRHFPFASLSRRVVARALLDSRRGRAVSTPGPVCTVHRAAAHCLPAGVLMDVWELLRKA